MVPGDINTRTGGYRYDKAIIQSLQQQGWTVELISLDGHYPFPDETDRQLAHSQLESIPDDSTVVFDGLAYSVLPDQLKTHQQRLRFIALIHHPLAMETGISTASAALLTDLETRALACATHVITTSQSTADSLHHFAVPTNKLSVVCPGTDPAPVATGSSSAGLDMLCVATLTPRKGHAVLIEALAQLKDERWHLYLVGSPDRDSITFEQLKAQCEAFSMESRVTFLGELDEQQLAIRFEQSDLFVLASFHEGYGMVLDEAIAYGLPVVATAGGALSDTLPVEAGLLSPPGDVHALAGNLRRVMQDKQLMKELRQGALHARKSIRSWRTAAQEFETAIMKSHYLNV